MIKFKAMLFSLLLAFSSPGWCGFPVQNGAPQVTVQGRMFAVGVFPWATPYGEFKVVGVYEKQPNGEWNEAQKIYLYANQGEMLADLNAQGGGAAYVNGIVDKANAFFAELFSAAPPPVSADPTTDQEALIHTQTNINARKFVLDNGIPVLK